MTAFDRVLYALLHTFFILFPTVYSKILLANGAVTVRYCAPYQTASDFGLILCYSKIRKGRVISRKNDKSENVFPAPAHMTTEVFQIVMFYINLKHKIGR